VPNLIETVVSDVDMASVVQRMALLVISRSQVRDEVIVHGGTALRLFYGFPRVGNDLDLYSPCIRASEDHPDVIELRNRLCGVLDQGMPKLCADLGIDELMAKRLLKVDIFTLGYHLRRSRKIDIADGYCHLESVISIVGKKCWRVCQFAVNRRPPTPFDIYDIGWYARKILTAKNSASVAGLAAIMRCAPHYSPIQQLRPAIGAGMEAEYDSALKTLPAGDQMSFPEALKWTSTLLHAMQRLLGRSKN
jgi:Nucleotidyl transferase AbiEii toxin, Type IV TA system